MGIGFMKNLLFRCVLIVCWLVTFCYSQSTETAFMQAASFVRENFSHRSNELMGEFQDDAFFQRRELLPEQKSDLDDAIYSQYLKYSRKQFGLYMSGALSVDSFFSNIGSWILDHNIQRLVIPPNREQAESFLRKAQVLHQQYQRELQQVGFLYPQEYGHFLEQQEENHEAQEEKSKVYESMHFLFPAVEKRDQIPYSDKENAKKHRFINTVVFRRDDSENMIRTVSSWESRIDESDAVQEALTPALFKAFRDKDLFLLPGGNIRLSQIHSINIVPKSLWSTAPQSIPIGPKASVVKKVVVGDEVSFKFYLPEGLSAEEVAVHMQELQRKTIGNDSSDVITFNPLLEAYGKTEKLLGAGAGASEECFPPAEAAPKKPSVIYDF